jgi:Ni/Fe-hydrogenase subunit HybB-like protein
MAVLVLLVLDLGRWDRFWSFFINWNVHSPLFEISWCIVLYSTVLVIEASPQLFERLGKQRPVRWVYRIVIAW